MNNNSFEQPSIKVSKDTQKFVADLADLPSSKANQVQSILSSLQNQQHAEANLESKRGWRHMWQRTPKPFLLMLGYCVFLAPVGSFAYQAYPKITDLLEKIIFLSVFWTIAMSTLGVVFYLSYHYVKNSKQFEDKLEEKTKE